MYAPTDALLCYIQKISTLIMELKFAELRGFFVKIEKNLTIISLVTFEKILLTHPVRIIPICPVLHLKRKKM